MVQTVTLLIYLEWVMSCVAEMNCGSVALLTLASICARVFA